VLTLLHNIYNNYRDEYKKFKPHLIVLVSITFTYTVILLLVLVLVNYKYLYKINMS